MSLLATARPLRIRPSGHWQCTRCGHVLTTGKPHPSGECEDCRGVDMKPVKKKRTRELASRVPGLKTNCKAWTRDFDEDDNPTYPDGTLVAPGDRVCGHRDCVAEDHIIPPTREALVA